MPIIAKSGNELNAAILLAWGAHPSVRLWRANAGQAWVPTASGARPVQMNVPGCADLIGIGPHGIFLAIETKSATDVMRESQKNFRAMVERMGGVYIEARSVEDVDRVLLPMIRGAA
jgi:hypothetical protein